MEFHALGVTVTIATPSPQDDAATQVYAWLRQEFLPLGEGLASGFQADVASRIRLELRLRGDDPPAPSTRLYALLSGPSATRVYGAGPTRICLYPDGSWIKARNGRKHRRFDVGAPAVDGLYETARETLLNALSEALDRKGAHRVRALGFSRGRACGLIVLPNASAARALPPSASLTALAAQLAGQGEVRILSSESPLLFDGRAFPFPLNLALAPEVAQALDAPARFGEGRVFRPRKGSPRMLFRLLPEWIAEPAPVGFVLVIDPSLKDAARIAPTQPARARGALLGSEVLGLGLGQKWEHWLRAEAVPSLGRVAASRLRAGLALSKQARPFLFELERDARANARALEEFLFSKDALGPGS